MITVQGRVWSNFINSHGWERNSAETFRMGYEYPDFGKNKVVLPSAVTMGDARTEYTYDGNGNITSIKAGGKTTTYVYDELNRLVRENNALLNKTVTYRYNVGGNLVEEKEYAYTTGTLPSSTVKTTTGTFAAGWKDQLLTWGGTSMTYDGCGNMLTKGNATYTWTQGRKLSGVENGKSIRYYYDHTGARVKKEVDGTVTEYRMAGKLIVSEKTGDAINWYHYDSAGNPYAAGIGGTRYYFIRNLQGDVTGLIDGSGNQVVEYQYDSYESKGNSYFNGYFGGTIGGFIQGMSAKITKSKFKTEAAGVALGGSLGVVVGTAITDVLNNMDPDSVNTIHGKMVINAVASGFKGLFTSSVTAYIGSAVDMALSCGTGGLMPAFSYGFGEGIKAFFGWADDAMVYA